MTSPLEFPLPPQQPLSVTAMENRMDARGDWSNQLKISHSPPAVVI